MPSFRTRNTATDYETALTNCSYCSVGSIINKTSDEVRQDSGDAFYQKKNNGNDLALQIQAITKYMKSKSYIVSQYGTAVKPLSARNLLVTLATMSLGTECLLVHGETVQELPFVDSVHWIMVRKETAGLRYYDYQMKIADGNVKQKVKTKHNNSLGDNEVISNVPMFACGEEAELDNDYCAVLLSLCHTSQASSL